MAYYHTCKRFIKRKMGVNGHFFNAFKWIKPEDFENLTKILKHDNRTSLIYISHAKAVFTRIYIYKNFIYSSLSDNQSQV